ncbi:hypothetical protein TNCT_676711 [Trichonephila clavata]|uniref:Uncharacterized protein n=1 Tax=Trichonephila clavata TaxID=2740835 RepID=A0A8X6G720_TRICU|nr:hypothetical protein TNCT_676711 [Trichonephila clavata]
MQTRQHAVLLVRLMIRRVPSEDCGIKGHDMISTCKELGLERARRRRESKDCICSDSFHDAMKCRTARFSKNITRHPAEVST